MRLKTIINYLDKHKVIMGLDKYKILVNVDFVDMDNALAEVTPRVYDKVLKFSLSKNFKKRTDEEQKSILIHELLHGRYCIFEQEKKELTDYLEEQYINDLERGIFSILK